MMLDQYEVIKQIGEGGAGRVYQARHKTLDEMACLKQNIHPGPRHVGRLRDEAKLLWRLGEHHSIPGTKDFVEIDKDNAVMVMPYIQGKTLSDILQERSRLHDEDACWVTERLLEALHYIHSYGVVHADIKPENLFIEPKKHDVKLIDFGISVERPTRETTPEGYSPRYAAPELARGQPPIPQTDIYGAGIVMLAALGGDIAKREVPPRVPEPIARYCQRMIRHDVKERPSWEDNIIEELTQVRTDVFGRAHSR